ncbi:heterokaryon incompatibility protein [Colletotrichum karsti]|uniref:Heterokaryon incompatibility protein n=1 Tax=Colletotrichum karsti TaxID=1095194 RepID=A0A9P6LH23_9PEZI|nr:heterokaryon incompatibility protein [Colletotrichum karsti]KAF9872072.1 heterokaryon incompatibility protein [Colletotrichum karsti]
MTNGLAGDTSSPLSLQRVRSWVMDCESNHQQCGRGVDMNLPTRLIDVTEIFRGDAEGVRLAETQGNTGTYMCLSHCWGKILIKSKTENASLRERLDFIPWSLLPPSFQQAIEVTRKLGIRYLWIDSLCIIQDDADDWEREAAQMVNVYRNAYATIAISWSHDSQGGCYSKTIPPVYSKITTEEGDEFTIALALGAKRDDLSEYERVQEYFPLFNRAWCLQERLLSRRIIHFNFGELAFDCGKGYSCECGGKQHYNWHNVVDLSGTYTPLRSRSKYLALLNNSTTVSSNAIMTDQGKLDPYVRWHRLVSEYTCLNLTVTTDMLPAFSGLAHEMAEITGDTYLAGLWKNNLEQDLMWHVVSVADWRNQREKILKRGWIAPSWSWASTGSGCKVGFPIFSGAEVLEKKTPGIVESVKISCHPSGTDPTGSVSFGRLEVESRRLPVLIQRPCSRWDVKRRWTDRVYGRFLLYARENDREWQEDCRPWTGQEPLELGPVKSSLWVDPTVERMGKQYIRKEGADKDYKVGLCKHCAFLSAEILYIRGMKTDKGALSSRLRDFFLVVTKDPESSTDSYVRVGMLEIISDNREDREDWFESYWEQLALPSTIIAIS